MELTKILQHEVEEYSGLSIKAKTFAISDTAKQTYSVIIVPDFPRKFEANIMVLARIVDDKVIIEEDTTDRPL